MDCFMLIELLYYCIVLYGSAFSGSRADMYLQQNMTIRHNFHHTKLDYCCAVQNLKNKDNIFSFSWILIGYSTVFHMFYDYNCMFYYYEYDNDNKHDFYFQR